MIESEAVVVATEEQVSTMLEDEVAIFHLVSGTYYSLNEVGARIWELVQEPRPVSAVVNILVSEYDIEQEHCETYVLTFLENLANEDLIVIQNG